MAIQQGDIIQGGDGSIYDLVWDGGKGSLVFRKYGTSDFSEFTHAGTHVTLGVRPVLLADPQDNVDGQAVPGYLGVNSDLKHRIAFWIDLSQTPGNPGTISGSTATSSTTPRTGWRE